MLALFVIWGLAQLVFSVLGVLALTRYRAMIPFMFVLFLLEHLARRWILLVKPIARSETPPGIYINLVIFVLMIVGLAPSQRIRADLRCSSEAPPRPRTGDRVVSFPVR